MSILCRSLTLVSRRALASASAKPFTTTAISRDAAKFSASNVNKDRQQGSTSDKPNYKADQAWVAPALDHSKHDALWRAERYLSLALLGVLPAAWIIPHPIMDYAVATSLVVHVHWGVEAIVTDYVRPALFGPVIPKVSIALVYVLSVLAAGGLFLFNWTDVGITQAFRMLARI